MQLQALQAGQQRQPPHQHQSRRRGYRRQIARDRGALLGVGDRVAVAAVGLLCARRGAPLCIEGQRIAQFAGGVFETADGEIAAALRGFGAYCREVAAPILAPSTEAAGSKPAKAKPADGR